MTNHDLTKNLDVNLTTDIAILDFAKAFDVMPHQRLLIKLDFYGIRSHTKDWSSSFLTKRFQRVVVNGKSSDWSPVLSGAPQGTVLGPHLFLLHINNIHDGISSTIRLFADDCLVYNTIKSQKDEDSLQQDLHKLVSWADEWGMRFNNSKCTTMRISRGRNKSHPTYNMMGVTTLEETKESNYLGVYIQNDLRWNAQVNHVKSKASKVLNFLKRNFHHTSQSTKRNSTRH